jgi:hypothetical protein
MPKKSNKRVHKSRRRKTKQSVIKMVGCSRKHRLRNNICPNCGVNCKCGANCMCPKNCRGNCSNNHPSKVGGSGCGSSGCPISPMSWNKMNKFGGGATANAMPGPFVGNHWSPTSLPGQNGIGGDNNYFKPVNVGNDPALKMKLNGGGLIPQDLVNLGRSVGYNFGTAYSAINGIKPPVDPAPYKGQLIPRGF